VSFEFDKIIMEQKEDISRTFFRSSLFYFTFQKMDKTRDQIFPKQNLLMYDSLTKK
jgi:hypothetical protein